MTSEKNEKNNVKGKMQWMLAFLSKDTTHDNDIYKQKREKHGFFTGNIKLTKKKM